MKGAFEILFSEGVKEDLKEIRAYDRRKILDAIEAQLTRVPNSETKQRKFLPHLLPPFEAVPPIWQLRVGLFRIFYDVSEAEHRVYIRAIRQKPAHLKTEEIL